MPWGAAAAAAGPFTHLWLSQALLLSPCRLRSWTSCSSTPYTSRHERSRSPTALPSTVSLDTMPKFAFSSEDESPCVASSKPERPKFVLGEPDAGTGGVVKPSVLSGVCGMPVWNAPGPPEVPAWLGVAFPHPHILPPPFSAADLVSLNHIRLRSNSTGTKTPAPRGLEPGGSRRLSSQKDVPDRQRASPGSRVPKSASVSALSLIITSGLCPARFVLPGARCHEVFPG